MSSTYRCVAPTAAGGDIAHKRITDVHATHIMDPFICPIFPVNWSNAPRAFDQLFFNWSNAPRAFDQLTGKSEKRTDL